MGWVKLTEQEARSRSAPLQEDMRVQQRLWRLEHAGFWWLLAVLLLTLLGLFSKGLLSSSHAVSAEGQLTVEYERFLRNGASTSLVIGLHGQPGAALPLTITGALLDGLTVESITPPATQAATADARGMRLQLLADGNGEARVHLAVRADGVGLYRSQIQGGGGHLALNQFIYP